MANKKKGTVAELTSTSSGGSTNNVAKGTTPTPAEPLLTTVKGTQSTANTVGSQQPYSFKNLKTGSDYKPAQKYKSVGDVSYDQYNAVDAPELNNYSSVGDVKYNQYSAGTPLDYQNYSVGNQLQLGNYTYTPQELLQLNERGLDANSQNIINEYQRLYNGDGGYANYLNSAKQNSLDALNRQYNDAARNYYQQYKSNQNKLPEQLSRLGVTGGGSETAQLGLMNNYSGNLYNNESARAQQASNMNAQYEQMMADYNKGLAEQMANAYLNMARGLQSENWSRQASNNQGLNEANRFNVGTQNDATIQNWNRANTVRDQNVGLANEAREKNWNRANTISDLNTEQANQALYQNWQNNQDIADKNTGLANDLALQVWQNLQNISDRNTETANQAIYQNWQNNQDIADKNTGLANDASLTNWNWGNQVRQYDNQGQNEARQNNTAYNISEMQTLRNREWETMDKEQAHEWEQAGIKDERQYNMALYMLENGGNASMVKKMLGLSDKQAKNLEKAWKKAQKSNSSSGSGGGTGGYYRSSGGGTTTGGIDMSGYGQNDNNSNNNTNNNSNKTTNKTTNKTEKTNMEKGWETNYRKYRNMVLGLVKNPAGASVVKSTLNALVSGSQVSNSQLKTLWKLYNQYAPSTTTKKTTTTGSRNKLTTGQQKD